MPSDVAFVGLLDSMQQRVYRQPPILSGMSDLRPKNQPSGASDAALNEHYVMSRAATIQTFVREHRLRSTLLEARKPLEAAFGSEAIKKLEIIRDDEGYETLFCSVILTGSVIDARASLRSFDEQWWVERCNQVNGKLNFDFELG
jgi:hypothetical protein